ADRGLELLHLRRSRRGRGSPAAVRRQDRPRPRRHERHEPLGRRARRNSGRKPCNEPASGGTDPPMGAKRAVWGALAVLALSAAPAGATYQEINQFGAPGLGVFSTTTGVTTDSSGNVYVTDASLSRVDKFDSSGGLLTTWGSFGGGSGQFNDPIGI